MLGTPLALATFTAGVAAQVAFLVSGQRDARVRRWAWLGAPAVALVFQFLGWVQGYGYDGSPTVLGLCLFSMCLGAPELMPRIDASYVFGVTLAAWSAAIVTWAPEPKDLPALVELASVHPLLACWAAGGTLLLAIPVLARLRFGPVMKVALYLWFFFLVLAIGGLRWFSMGEALDLGKYHGTAAAFCMFSQGMATCFLCAHGLFLASVLSALWVEAGGPSNRHDRRDARQRLWSVVGLFSDRRPAPSEVLTILVANLGALALRYAAGAPDVFVAGAVLGATPLLHAQLVKSERDVQRDGEQARLRARKADAAREAARPS